MGKRILLALLILLSCSIVGYGYGSWQSDVPENIPELEVLVEELTQTIDRAEINRSAHPAFLKDLREIQYGFVYLLEEMSRDSKPQWGEYGRSRPMIEVTDLHRVLGNITPLETGGWETGRAGTPTLAIWDDMEYSMVAIEATVTFLRGKEITMGLYQQEGYLVAMGGIGVSRSMGFVGSGDARAPGRLWQQRHGQNASIAMNQPYVLRVEIRPGPSSTRIDLFIDGENILSHEGETQIEKGYIAIRTWMSEVRVEDIQIEELRW